ncbi:unnamed protein product [Rhodiola kirilowii]
MQHNTKDSSVRLAYEAQPRPKAIAALYETTVTKVACGTNHTVAVDSKGFVYTWGFGGYERRMSGSHEVLMCSSDKMFYPLMLLTESGM